MFLLFLIRFLMPGLAMAGVYNYSSMDFINQGSAQVGRNYIKNGGGEVNKLGWSTFADAASSTPADGTGGSPNSTWTTTTSSPLRGSGSFLWTKSSGASRQGEGVSYDFTVDSSDKGKVLQIKFDYAIASGTFVDDDMTVWVYDVTNATMIQPAPYKLKNHSLASETFGLEFQTATTSTSYRLILYVPVTTNSANTVKFDNFSIGPANLTRGPPVTDWVSFTPTGSWVANSTYTGFWRRVGDQMEVHFKIALSGAPTSATLTVNLPSGYTVDTNKITAASTTVVGTGNIDDTSSNSTIGARLDYSSTTAIDVRYIRLSGSVYDYPNVNATTPVTFANGDSVSGTFMVPISGWSSSAIMSSDADTRVVAAQYYVSASTANSSFADDVAEIVDFDTKVLDTHNAATTGASWKYTAPVKGVYRIFSTLRWANATNLSDSDLILYKNGSQYLGALARVDSGSMGYDFRGSQILELNAGDYVQIYASQNDSAAGARTINTANRTYIYIEKLSGPSQIAASETVAARYTTNNADTLNSGVNATINYLTKVFDTHGSVSIGVGAWSAAGGGNATSNWRFTAPIAGTYVVSSKLYLNDTTTFGGTNYWTHALYKNGSLYSNLANRRPVSGEDYPEIIGSSTIRLVAGDYIDIRASQNAGNIALLNDGNYNYVDIYRIGN